KACADAQSPTSRNATMYSPPSRKHGGVPWIQRPNTLRLRDSNEKAVLLSLENILLSQFGPG
ncbi:MAG: hypothetical protein KDF61_17625, partial [Rhodocyclaceae bacterium]|nr:hypothetical protein [Rhodocyclaceae bacterium]